MFSRFRHSVEWKCRQGFASMVASFLLGFFVAWLLWSDTLRYVFVTLVSK